MHLYYDGSFDGFLTAVFDVYALKQPNARISAHTQSMDLFSRTHSVITDPEKAQRVWRKLKNVFGQNGIRYILQGALYECDDRDTVLLAVIQHAMNNTPKSILSDFANANVLRLSQYVKRVNRECHRTKAFVRFARAADNTYCAAIEPDFDVLPIVTPFFRRRYADQCWLIADLHRHYAVYYDCKTIELLPLDKRTRANWRQQPIHDDEAFYQRLWQDYFRATNIRERANRRLHVQHMPLRYWQYLTEKNPLF